MKAIFTVCSGVAGGAWLRPVPQLIFEVGVAQVRRGGGMDYAAWSRLRSQAMPGMAVWPARPGE
ncbi:hypothetical protein DN069_31160 [Streptacidiphilus pinicola]|uniref:Uncharacterized protein n=1 Tax=Streptacidiphilus pinicola TaxID=2219663 RepID=A0A2X0IEA6_9ACTN|nr:hypothetical protein DN069_31160 [Streptacidiphilus pinicola]